MAKKYFGTDGIRGAINSKNINGDMFFKFGLSIGTYFIVVVKLILTTYSSPVNLTSSINFFCLPDPKKRLSEVSCFLFVVLGQYVASIFSKL